MDALMKEHAPPQGRGRRPAEICAHELERLIRDGLTLKAAAAALGYGERTLGTHLARSPHLRAAVRAGKRGHVDGALEALHRRAAAGSIVAIKLVLKRAEARHDDAEEAR